MTELKGVCEVCSEAAVLRADDYAEECDRLTAQLTSAKEEIKAKEQSFRLCFDHGGSPGPAPDYCPKCIASERKETERLQYELNQIFGMACDAPELNMSNYDVDQVAALNAAMVEIWQIAKAALQERQGEE